MSPCCSGPRSADELGLQPTVFYRLQKELFEQDRLSPDLVFRDPYLLDFLGLADTYSERDLETAILRELERFA